MLWALGWSKGEASQTLTQRLIEGGSRSGRKDSPGDRQASSKAQMWSVHREDQEGLVTSEGICKASLIP